MTAPTTRVRPRFTRALLLLVVSALCALAGLSSSVSSASAETSGGWIRLTHLSPDTAAVNVALTSVGNSKAMVKLSDVKYGDVSAYTKVPAGQYVASMTPAGGGANSKPVVTQSVTVKNGYAYTVAAVGTNADLKGVVLNDDLRAPSAGNAKVRLLQASTNAPTVTVTAVDGPVLARDASFASATGYAQIKAGVWTVNIKPDSGKAAAINTKVTAVPGSVNTIVVLDNAQGGVAAKVLRDASNNTTSAPKKGKGVDTGLGGTATQFVDGPAAGAGGNNATSGTPAMIGGGALLLLALTLFVRRSRRNDAAAVQNAPARGRATRSTR